MDYFFSPGFSGRICPPRVLTLAHVAPGSAPTTSQIVLSRTGVVPCWDIASDVDAERWRSPAAGSGSAADAVGSQVQRQRLARSPAREKRYGPGWHAAPSS